MTIMGFKKSSKTKDLSYWHKKLWKVFSNYIRLRDAIENNHAGYVRCISCGEAHYWKQMDAGHFINRTHLYIKYNEDNVHAQCKHCNAFRQGNYAGYREGLVKKIGKARVLRLEETRNYPAGFTADGLKLRYGEYKAKVNQMKKEIL